MVLGNPDGLTSGVQCYISNNIPVGISNRLDQFKFIAFVIDDGLILEPEWFGVSRSLSQRFLNCLGITVAHFIDNFLFPPYGANTATRKEVLCDSPLRS